MTVDLAEEVMHGVMTAIDKSGFVRRRKLHVSNRAGETIYHNQSTNTILNFMDIHNLVVNTLIPFSGITKPDGTVISMEVVTRSWAFHQTQRRLSETPIKS
jgi:hypothetical protein